MENNHRIIVFITYYYKGRTEKKSRESTWKLQNKI